MSKTKTKFDEMFGSLPSTELTEEMLSNDIPPINFTEEIYNLKEQDKKIEREYSILIDTMNITDDKVVEEFAKKSMIENIKSQKQLEMRSKVMMGIIEEMLSSGLGGTKEMSLYSKFLEMSSKLIDNATSMSKELYDMDIKKKNSERQDKKLIIQTNKIEVNNSQTNNYGSDKLISMSSDDIQKFLKTGKINIPQETLCIDSEVIN